MSFARDNPIEESDEDPYSGFRPLSPIQSELTLTSNDYRHQKNQVQTQQNMSSLLNKFIQKDKETEHLRREVLDLKDKLKEFEYLVIKGSEEVKKKQYEITSLNSVIDNMKLTMPSVNIVENLRKQFEEAQLEIHRLKSDGAQTQTKLRVEVQKEKDVNADLNRQVNAMRERLDGILRESKLNIDDLQKNFSMTSSKYTHLEKEYLEMKDLVKELTHENTIKNETLEQAHEVISKLKAEIENLVESGEAAQGKVKEYKGKCKVLKKNNASLKQLIADLEEQVAEGDSVRKELAQAREDYEAILRVRLEERMKEDYRKNAKDQEVPMEKQIANLKEKLAETEKENSEKTAEIMQLRNSCEDKTKDITALQETINKQEEKSKQEIQAFKTQTLRSYHALVQKLQEGSQSQYNRQGSPFKGSGYPLQSQKLASDVLDVSTIALNMRMQKGNDDLSTSRKSAGLVRTTPIKIFSNTKGQSFLDSRQNYNDSTDQGIKLNSNNVSPFKESEGALFDKRVEGFDTIKDIGMEERDEPEKEEPQEEIPLNFLGSEFFTDEIQRALDREQYFTLIIESLYVKAEIEVQRCLDKLKHQPAVNAELEAWRMRSEELEQRYSETVAKYTETSSIILDLTKNNKILMDRLESVSREYNHLSNSHKQQSETLKVNQAHYKKSTQSLISEIKMLVQLLRDTKVLSNSGRLVDLRSVNKLAVECDDYKKGMRSLERFIENINVFELSQTSTFDQRKIRSSSATRSSDRREARLNSDPNERNEPDSRLDLPVFKLKKKIEQYEIRIRQLQDEKEELKEKMNALKSEVRGWQETAHVMETDYKKTLNEKEKVIKRTQDELNGTMNILKETEHSFRRAETALAEKEFQIAKQNETLIDMTDRDEDISVLLRQKEELIRTLHHEKEDLNDKLDELNEYCEELKRQSGEESENHRLTKLENDIRVKNEELNMKEREIEERMDQIFDLEKIISLRDKEIAKIRNENIELRGHVYDLREESSRHESSRNRHHGGTLVYDDTASRTQGARMPRGDRHEHKDRRGSSIGIEGSTSISATMKRQGYGQRNSVGSKRAEKSVDNTQELAIRQLKEENAQLAEENRDIFKKLNELNDLINYNKVLEREVSELRQERELDNESKIRSPLKKEPVSGSRRKDNYNHTNEFGMSTLDNHLEGEDDEHREKQENREPNGNTQGSDNIQFMEKYKAKTKKVFQKRVKELEMLLRYVDHKVRGYNFDRSSYVICSTTKEGLSLEERKTLAKLGYLVETMLEKNTNLKEFVEEMIKRIENLHVKNHNLTAVVGKIFKAVYKDTANKEEFGGPVSPSNAFYEVERLSSTHNPEIVTQFEQIEMMSMTRANSNAEFFDVFALVEPRLNNISDLLLKSLKNNPTGRTYSLSFITKAEDYLGSKIQKMKEVENLQAKLADLIEQDKIQDTCLPDHIKGYFQTYSNIYIAVINEFQSMIDFASNLIQGNNISSQESGIVQNLSNYGSNSLLNKVTSLYIPERQTHTNNPFSAVPKELDSSALFPAGRLSAISAVNRTSDLKNESSEHAKYGYKTRSNPFTPTKLGDYSGITEERLSQGANTDKHWGKVSTIDFEHEGNNDRGEIHSWRM